MTRPFLQDYTLTNLFIVSMPKEKEGRTRRLGRYAKVDTLLPAIESRSEENVLTGMPRCVYSLFPFPFFI